MTDTVVDLSRVAKQLKKLPIEVRTKLQQWVMYVETKGLKLARLFPGFKDHQLLGKRKGQRSVYLTKKWRVIYVSQKTTSTIIVKVEEVMPHDY